MDNCYTITITFSKDGQEPEQRRFRRVIGRSPQGAITKAFRMSRMRTGFRIEHENHGSEEVTIRIKCLGRVEK